MGARSGRSPRRAFSLLPSSSSAGKFQAENLGVNDAVLGATSSRSKISCMPPHELQSDEVLDQILEVERAAAIQELRERSERECSHWSSECYNFDDAICKARKIRDHHHARDYARRRSMAPWQDWCPGTHRPRRLQHIVSLLDHCPRVSGCPNALNVPRTRLNVCVTIRKASAL
jgi:hypothetical protein